ncbi:MAG: PQQ-binding-like beta-propeller repeat protein [Candidatus Bathyarchaeota archaeon]|nr:PQQ-binding-like beta-propeller repeat protein [Candidatus Bathyarchaeota archaeon]
MKRTKPSLIVLMLIFTLAITFPMMQFADAAVNRYNSYIYCFVSPNPVGVGQSALLVVWTADMPPDIGETAGTVPSPNGRAAWENIKVVVTKPDNTTETFIIPRTDPVGGGYVSYTPETTGTYYVQAFFPETWKNTTALQSYYSAAESSLVALTVLSEPIQPYAEAPLPEGYWTRPINALNRDWYVLAGNWLGGAGQQPIGAAGGCTTQLSLGKGPESAHVMWSKPYYAGGIMDENYGSTGYFTYFYQGFMFGANAGTGPIIMNGRIFYDYRFNAHQWQGYFCVDLYTGETIFYRNASTPSFGQIYNYESPNQHGGIPYLWKTSNVILPPGYITASGLQTWELQDGYTGEPITLVANVTAGGTAVIGKDGSILRYNLVNLGSTSSPKYYLQVWNSSAIPTMLSGTSGTNYWSWRPAATNESRQSERIYSMFVHNGNNGFSLNLSIPSAYILGPTNTIQNQTATIRAIREGEFIILGTSGINDDRGTVQGVLTALSLEPGKVGNKLWDSTFLPPFAPANVTISIGGVYPEDNVISFKSAKQLKRWGYDMRSGQKLWESEPEPAGNYYGMSDNVYEGKLLTCGYGGVLLAYDMRTGKILWNFTAKTEGFESPYGGNYPMGISNIADGKIYIGSGEHSWTQPLYRGKILQCINASNGALLWNLPIAGVSMPSGNAGSNFAIADGYLVALNGYDAMIYCIGKGPSGITVTASPKASILHNTVLLEGTVTDQSPAGKRNINGDLETPLKGTPAISDEDMTAWMEYIYMQQPKPANAKGVPVSLYTIDPNGNYIHIGDTVSDINGNYALPYTPEVPGTYQIIANFAGSKSYGPSTQTTYIVVSEGATPKSTDQPISTSSNAEMYIIGIGAAIILAIAIVGAIIVMMLKKRP